MIARRIIFTIAFCCQALLFMNGCATVGYYAQAVKGQTELILKQRSIDFMLASPELDDNLQRRLQRVVELRRFSIEQLGLPGNASYSRYADLQREFVVWNIFATPEFSLQPLEWCYLVIGCLPYRGYFDKTDALRQQQQLLEQGYDVYLGGVTAYSTLGWFADPVLNTMLKWSETYLAKVMFHELAHQQLYVTDDTEFNESYAEAVAIIGVQRWLMSRQDTTGLERFRIEQAQREQFTELVMAYRKRLEDLFISALNETAMRERKHQIYDAMRNDYGKLKQSWGEGNYDNWFNSGLNNAKLASVATYHTYVEDMLGLYEKIGKNLSFFYDILEKVSNCERERRASLLKQRSILAGC